MSDFDDAFGDMLEDASPPPPKKPKTSFFKKRNQPVVTEEEEDPEDLLNLFEDDGDTEDEPSPPPKKKKKPKLLWGRKSKVEQVETEEDEVETDQTWERFSSDMLTENDAVEEVEDVVERPEREIGTRIKNEININEARNLDLSLRERIQLTQMYINSGQEELKQLEEFSKQEEIRVNHVITLRDFLMTELSEYLHDVNTELVIEIDAKFGPYIDEVISELTLSYFCKEIPRNRDLVNLEPNLPYKYSFMIRAI